MSATSDEAMESLLLALDEIYDDTKHSVTETQSSKSNFTSEMKKREDLELSIHSLRSENERNTKIYFESIGNLAEEIELRANFERVKEELKNGNSEKENWYRNSMDLMKQHCGTKIEELESIIRCYEIQKVENEAELNQLHQNLALQRNHIENLTKRLEEVGGEVELRNHYEIQGLNDCLVVEQEEKIELSKKVENLEKELLVSRRKLAGNQMDLTSNQHAETLKQKVMKLRKDNEVLKRRLLDSKKGLN